MNVLDNTNVGQVLEALSEIMEDSTVPRNVKVRVQQSIGILNENTEVSIKVNKVLNELDEVADDINMQSYVRTKIWNVVSMLEKL